MKVLSVQPGTFNVRTINGQPAAYVAEYDPRNYVGRDAEPYGTADHPDTSLNVSSNGAMRQAEAARRYLR